MKRMPPLRVGSTALALAVLIGTASGAVDDPSANLLPNPSFSTRNARGVAGWLPRAWSGAERARWVTDSPGRGDASCVSIASDRGADAAWTAVVPVRPHTFYRLSGWIRTRDVRGAAGALLNVQNQQTVRTPAVRGTRDWTRVSTVFRTRAVSSLEINALFGGWGESSGQAWYDELALEQVADVSGSALGMVSIDADGPTVTASPMLLGGFLEHFDRQVYGGVFEPGSPLSDERGFRRDVVAALRELRLSVVRWPGGCFASGYRWRDGVGERRRPVPDPVWGVVDPNTFGTDEFLAWCRLVGCAPYICTNAGSGTAEEMRDWVAYCNARVGGDGPVRYWSVGNENWGGWEIGASTPEKWGPLVRRSADLMREADPALKLVAAATPERSWTLPLLAASGKQLDYVAIHEYWLPLHQKNEKPDYPSCITLSDGPERTIGRVIALLDEAGVRGRVKIAFDEWNLRGWHHPGFPRKAVSDPADPSVGALIRARDRNDDASRYTMADALFSASFLNACLRHADDVGMANIAPIVNTRGPLFVHPGGIVKRTTFHVLAMYASRLHDRVARSEFASPLLEAGGRSVPVLDAVATRDEGGCSWRIALVNRHPTDALRCAVRLGKTALAGAYKTTLLQGPSPDAFNDLDAPDRVSPREVDITFQEGVASLPPHSLMILRLER
ncbi:MAG: alpha-L-arabinofuranosidase C-terminal domain-containing protein [Isosphaeraceae bacterium]